MEPKVIRVLHVVTVMNLGGIETLLMSLYRNIDRTKIQFDFLVHREDKGFFDDEIISLGGRILHIKAMRPFYFWSYSKVLSSLLKKNQYSIVHSHLNANSSIILGICKKCNIPIRIAHSHIDTAGGGMKGFLKSILKRKINSVATHRLACSQQAGEWLYGSKYEFLVFKNAIKSSNFIFSLETRKKIRERYGFNEKTVVIGNVARFNQQKNHSFIIDVFFEFQKINEDCYLLLLGEGELFEDIKNKVKDLHLCNKVIFTGAVANANEYLNAMDLFLFPSLYEGLGIVAVEAQCNGLPIVMTESLPKEVEITELISRVNLNDSAVKWAEALMRNNNSSNDRLIFQEIVRDSGYDIIENVEWLEQFYSNM